MSICEHVDLPDTAVQVVRAPNRSEVEVRCPCCNLRAYRTPGETADMAGDRCPYCDVQAVTA